MSQDNFVPEEPMSPDMFSDPDVSVSGANMTDDSTSSTSGTIAEPVEDYPEWKGVSIDEIRKGFSPYDFHYLPPIMPSHNHSVLFALPLPSRGPPKPYPPNTVDKWNQDYVRLPHSPHSRYPNNKEDETQGFRQRWEVIQEALLQSFYTSRQLEIAILSYNHKYSQRWDFRALHYFFKNVVDEPETEIFFETLLPKIIGLALQLPELVTGGIPLLKRHMNASISLSQLQIASLLANAFLCTFPRRNSSNPQSEYANYPHINFNRLFSSLSEKRSNRTQSVMEKLKCIIHYFRRVTSKQPTGTITIQRKYIAQENFPKWESCDDRLPLLHITNKGTIESGVGFLQVDFANKFLGGGVMNFGCVQEEIRFVICPELFVTMLVTEALDDTEALVICGVEQYSKYEGYSDNFQWAGDYVDETPRDNSGRRKTCIVAIDALQFTQPNLQFNMDKITRELNKAYVGFCAKDMPTENLCAVATGNWGCGAFRGNPKLKVLLQLISAAVAKRSVVYYTFGDTELRDSVADMYWYLVGQNVTIGQLYEMLADYNADEKTFKSKKHSDFYRFLYNKTKMKKEKLSQPKLTFQPKQKKLTEKKSSTSEVDANKLNDIPLCKLTEEERKAAILKILEASDDEEGNNEKEEDELQINKRFDRVKAEADENENEFRERETLEKEDKENGDENSKCTNSVDEKALMKDDDTKRGKVEQENGALNNQEEGKKKSLADKVGIVNGKIDLSNGISNANDTLKKQTQRKISDFFTPVR